jgi:RNA polymerase subunit RPABC4/transcription elongation factor Spt4
MRTVPVDKACKLCKQKKLLVEFDVNNKAADRRDRICKTCRASTSSSELCQVCISQRIAESSIPTSEILLEFVKAGIELPDELLNNLAYILHLSGFRYLCDGCGKEESRKA